MVIIASNQYNPNTSKKNSIIPQCFEYANSTYIVFGALNMFSVHIIAYSVLWFTLGWVIATHLM